MCHIIRRLASPDFPLYWQMMENRKNQNKTPAKKLREEKLAEALRANLKRRKKQPGGRQPS